ncbi:MAG: fimbria/pilus outer membrane usher protein [Anaeromyxobacteraceae bacterium]|nr:fimbria/pilus outer membrane usher protein [Anaeromyxobacteraceae bacterium]
MALALGLSVAAPPAVAAPEAPETEGPRPAFLTPIVNGVPREALLFFVDGQLVSLRREDLHRLGLRLPALPPGEPGDLLSLGALLPTLEVRVDEEGLAVRLTAGPDLLGRQDLDLRPSARPAGLERGAARGGFVNYTARADTGGGTLLAAEAGVGWRDHLLLGAVTRDPDGQVRRGLTALETERPERLARVTLGDAVPAPQPLGAAAVVGGLTVERDLAMDPYLVQAPLPRLSAFAATPSTVEVWVNDALVRTEPVAPGTLDLSNLPVTTGQNDVRVVVRDAFGRRETVESARYQAQGLLAPGLHAFSWSAGFLREGFGTAADRYGAPALLAHHRLGVTPHLTLGARLEASPEVASGGGAAVLGLPVGTLQAGAAASARGGRWGWAWLGAWRFSSRLGTAGLDATWRSDRYATLDRPGLPADAWRLGTDVAASFGGRATWRLGAVFRERAGGEHLASGETSTLIRLGPALSAQVGGRAERSRDGRATWELFASLVVTPGAGLVADASAGRTRTATTTSLGVSRPLPAGPGWGLRARAATGDAAGANAVLQAQGAAARAEVEWIREAGVDLGAASVAGALVIDRGVLFATRPIDASYAVVEVPGVSGARVYLDEQPVGRTGANGTLLVPGLQPYYANRLRLEAQDVPLDRTLGRLERLVAPPRRGGAYVQFEASPIRGVRGRLQLTGHGPTGPLFGTFVVEAGGRAISSPVDAEGSFWLEGVPAGNHPGRFVAGRWSCAVTLSVPEGAAPVHDAGDLGCRIDPPAGSNPTP